VKILWGMFAFPLLYPAESFRAASWPLLGMIALTLLWASGAFGTGQWAGFAFLIPNAALFAWLAVRIHRTVLLESGDRERTQETRMVVLASRYLAALTAGAVLKVVYFFLALSLFSLVSVSVAYFGPVTTKPPTVAPAPDPDIQRLINVVGVVGQAPVIYLLARLSTLLPALALDQPWELRSAWHQTRGNGWRLALIVFMLPWALSAATDLAFASTENNLLGALLAVARAVLLALGVIALSLSYRELTAAPEPPPTAPPA